ncbi:MAG TPA: L-serine ammonia-lyase, iron-sulfur-dependent subunit beta [Trueperaceae bacterium]
MGLLDVIGPVMIGPSSSHTAGACRLALLARRMLISAPRHAELTLHGSFAKTARGHGTDKALVAGLLGMFPDDPRIPQAPELARAAGLEVAFATADLGDVHPNTVRIELSSPEEEVSMMGSSLGGGMVRVFQVNGFEIDFSGSCYALLIEHNDRPGVIARVARVIADDDGNIGRLHSARRRRGGQAMMSVEVDKHLSQYVLDYLTNLPYISWVRMLPEVMSGEQRGELGQGTQEGDVVTEGGNL